MDFRLRVLGGPRLQRLLERAKEYSEILGTSRDRVTIEPCSPLCRRARVRDLLKCGGAKGIRTPELLGELLLVAVVHRTDAHFAAHYGPDRLTNAP